MIKVLVRSKSDEDLEHAIKISRKKIQRCGKARAMRKDAHETKGEKRRRKHKECMRRTNKAERRRRLRVGGGAA